MASAVRLRRAAACAALAAGACRAAAVHAQASPEPPPRDPQESSPNVGLFRLPAHRGQADALAGPEGFGFLSKNDEFGMMLHPVLQADTRYRPGALENDADRSRFLVAFAGLALTARFYGRIRSELLVSFSGTTLLSQAWLDADLVPWLHVKVGQFPFPISFERLTASIFLPLAAADPTSALLPSVDTGAELWGSVAESTFEYNVGLVNGAVAGTGGPQVDADKHVVARATIRPFAQRRGPEALAGLVLGFGASAGAHSGAQANPELPAFGTWAGRTYFAYRTGTAAGSSIVCTGETYRMVPQVSWHAGPVSAYVELARTQDHAGGAVVTTDAGSAVLTLVLTGERSIPLHYAIPAENLDFSRGYAGAFELVAGGGALEVRDDGQLASRVAPTAAMKGATTIAGGLNWYPNLGVRVMLDGEHTSFTPVAGFSALRDENLIVGRFQVVL
jgi:phosphate-selective porin OprO/OprP